jgi:hypothetical protein
MAGDGNDSAQLGWHVGAETRVPNPGVQRLAVPLDAHTTQLFGEPTPALKAGAQRTARLARAKRPRPPRCRMAWRSGSSVRRLP